MRSPKEILQERFSSDYEKYYRVELFERKGFVRKKCTNCGKHFWTLKPDRKICDDSTCSPYAFIGDTYRPGMGLPSPIGFAPVRTKATRATESALFDHR